MPESRDEFWTPKSLDELAREQGVTKPQSLDTLIGAGADLWDSDEEFEQFLQLPGGIMRG